MPLEKRREPGADAKHVKSGLWIIRRVCEGSRRGSFGWTLNRREVLDPEAAHAARVRLAVRIILFRCNTGTW